MTNRTFISAVSAALSLLITVAALGAAVAQTAPAGPPRLSPMATVSQTVGISGVEITYGRPAVRERAIWGELVPWGEVWRTGANEATTISFSDDVRIDGEDLAAGKYALFSVPQEAEWTLIFNREAEQWGAFNYNQSEDALRVKVKPREAAFRERLEIGFPEVGTDTLVVSIGWAEVEVPFTVQVDLEATSVAKAREFVTNATSGDGRAVWNWANYCYQQGWNLEEAAGWATALADQAPMYWTHALKARLLAKVGRVDEAVPAAEAALARAQEESSQPGVTGDSANLEGELAGWRPEPESSEASEETSEG